MAQSAQDVAARWAQNMGSSTAKWKAGVDGVTVAPGQAAARQADVWANNVVASKGKWATNVASVSLQDWKDAMINKGGARIGSGAQAAQGKFADFMTQLLPRIDQVKSALPARGGLDANINRMVAFSRGMAAWQYKK
jgi:hypothetical protein